MSYALTFSHIICPNFTQLLLRRTCLELMRRDTAILTRVFSCPLGVFVLWQWAHTISNCQSCSGRPQFSPSCCSLFLTIMADAVSASDLPEVAIPTDYVPSDVLFLLNWNPRQLIARKPEISSSDIDISMPMSPLHKKARIHTSARRTSPHHT
jgi:hypothetical protein